MWKGLIKLLFPNYALQKSATVRYAFPLVMVTALFAGLASVVTQDQSFISIVTTPTTVNEGDQIYIEVRATTHTPVNAVDITVSYPESQIEVQSIDTGTSVITLWAEEPYARQGHVYLRGGTFKKGFLGEHTIARIRAKALTTGVAHVTTDTATLIAGDGRGTQVSVADTPAGETRIYINGTESTLTGKADVSIVTDIDGDGLVDLKDISVFMAAWFTRKSTFDFNGDGRMTFRDFSILLSDSFFR